MATTKVSQKYTASLNVSITKKDGRITRLTTWQTGVKGSTEVEYTE